MLSGNIKVFELLKRSYPKFKSNKLELGEKIYANMFEDRPDLKELFTNTPPGQSQRLIDAILFYCQEVENYELFYDRLDKIAHVHIKAGIKNDYYPYMQKAFIKAIKQVFKEEATDELIRAWTYGFESLSNELIHAENLIRKYSNLSSQENIS